jgi:MFS family permease
LLVYIPVLVALAAISMVYALEYAMILIGAMVFGAFVFTLYSLAAATANDMVNAEQRVQVAGALLITYGAGAVTGPILAGQFMNLLGPQGLFFYFALICLLLSAFAITTFLLCADLPVAVRICNYDAAAARRQPRQAQAFCRRSGIAIYLQPALSFCA